MFVISLIIDYSGIDGKDSKVRGYRSVSTIKQRNNGDTSSIFENSPS
jgi:hypothetical protein